MAVDMDDGLGSVVAAGIVDSAAVAQAHLAVVVLAPEVDLDSGHLSWEVHIRSVVSS